MEKIEICHLCLANSVNTNIITTNATIEIILQQHNISFKKRDLSDVSKEAFISNVCDSCWTKIDQFHQYYQQVETIHTNYINNFIKDDGQEMEFDDAQQFYIQVENMHSNYAGHLKDEIEVDKKLDYIEPFCIINVDENDTKNRKNVRNLYTETDRIDTVATKSSLSKAVGQTDVSVDVGAASGSSSRRSIKIKKETEQIPNSADYGDDIDDDDENDEEDDDDATKNDEDYDDINYLKDEEDGQSSDSSYVQSRPKEKIRSKSKKIIKKKKKKRPSYNESGGKSKKVVATSGVLDENSQRLLKYIEMKCDVCCDGNLYETFADIQNHFLDVHQQNGYVMCCNRKFRRIGRVLQHCTWHENPEAFKCTSCNKCFQDNVCLRDHITSMHIPPDERRFQCEICSRLFAKQHLLNTHLKMKHTVKEERPYKCPEADCEQRFVLPAYLRLHVEKVHNHGDSRVCDICARFFKCSKSYERHYQVEHTDIDQRVQCDLCQKWFKHLDTLKDHIRRHYAASATCKYCGRVSSNKKSLRLHIRNVHADIDDTVKSRNEFPCNVCEKIFKKKQTLREHMTLHTGEAFLYTCTFCSKTFRSSANMYAHRKRNHPREYEEKCVLARTQK